MWERHDIAGKKSPFNPAWAPYNMYNGILVQALYAIVGWGGTGVRVSGWVGGGHSLTALHVPPFFPWSLYML